jgi:uncharacterized protein YbjT (DUF2867 family)
MILVTGATGNVGSELVATLARDGEPVRALVRRPDAELPAGVQRATGNLNDPASMIAALDGVDGMFLMPGYDNMAGLLAEAAKAGVRQIVLLSGGGAGATDTDNAISRFQLQSEQYVRDSGIAWTILRPFEFMANTSRWLPQLAEGDEISVPFADIPSAVIDPHDIAAVAAVTLRSDGHAGRIYRLSGPEILLPAQRAEILGRLLGRRLRIRPQSNDEARADMSSRMPIEYVEAFFRFYVDGIIDESEVLPTVFDITGELPRTYEEWVRAHLDLFAPPRRVDIDPLS